MSERDQRERQAALPDVDSDDDTDAESDETVALALGLACLDCGTMLPDGQHYFCDACQEPGGE